MKHVINVRRPGDSNNHVFTQKAAKLGRDCCNCRHAQSSLIGGIWRFVCKLTQEMTAEGAARTCPDFTDSRAPRILNWHTCR